MSDYLLVQSTFTNQLLRNSSIYTVSLLNATYVRFRSSTVYFIGVCKGTPEVKRRASERTRQQYAVKQVA